jgi:hypothetical protein
MTTKMPVYFLSNFWVAEEHAGLLGHSDPEFPSFRADRSFCNYLFGAAENAKGKVVPTKADILRWLGQQVVQLQP